MSHRKITIDSFAGSSQVTVDGILQMTLLSDGSVQIDLAGKHIEVSRNGLQYLVSPESDTVIEKPAATLIEARP